MKKINEIGTSKLSKEFEDILNKFFNEDEVQSFIKKINSDMPVIDKVNQNAGNNRDVTLITESFFTSKLRLLSDRVITFASKKLDREKYFEFLHDLGKLLIIEGEYNLALEILNYIQKNSGINNNFEIIKSHAILSIADIYSRQALWKEAILHIKKARLYFERGMNPLGLGKCEHLMGTIYLEQGDLKAAKFRFENCLGYLKAEKNLLLTSMVEANLGIIKYIEGDLEAAYNYYKSGQKTFEELGDNRKLIEVKHNLGMIHIQRKDYEKAIKEYDDCIELSFNSRYLPTLGISYMNKAIIYLELNDLKLATLYANKAMEVCYQINDKLSIADIYKTKGVISRKLKDLESSEDFLLTSLRLNRDLHNELNYAETAYELGLLYKDFGKKEEAELFLNESLEYYKKSNSKTEIAKIKMSIS